MNSVFELITAVFDSNQQSPFWQSVEGRLYSEEAPEDAEHPYCVVTDSGSNEGQGFYFTLSEHMLTFQVYDNLQSPEKILRIGQELRDLFEYQKLSGDPLSLVGMRLTGKQLNRFPDIGVWEYLLTFDAILDNEK